jgi:heat shock protein HtpX
MAHNAIKTAALLAALAGALVGIGSLADGTAGALVALVIAGTFAAVSWRFSPDVALWAARARPVGPGELGWLRASVERLADRADLPPPRLYLSPSPQPNAFATGRTRRLAVLVVTEGLLYLLSPAEIEAVVAHELAHVRRGDILFTSVTTALATGICGVINLATFGLLAGKDNERGAGPVAMARFALLAPIGAAIRLTLAPSREFDADGAAAKLTGAGETLANALERIDGYAHDLPMSITPAQAQAWTVGPLARRELLTRAFSTHPPVGDRARRLRSAVSDLERSAPALLGPRRCPRQRHPQ